MKIGNVLINQPIVKTDTGKPISKEKESGVPWSPAVQVNVSEEGYNKYLQSLEEQNMIIHANSQTESIPEEKEKEIEVQRTFEMLVEACKKGEALTVEEEKRLAEELEEKIGAQYQEMLEYEVPPLAVNKPRKEMTQDEKGMDDFCKELKFSELLRARTLADMQKEIEQEKAEAKAKEQEAKLAKGASETADKVSELEMLRKSLDEKAVDEHRETEKEDEEEQQENKLLQTEEALQNGVEKSVHVLTQAQEKDMKMVESINLIQERQQKEAAREREYTRMFEDHFTRTMEAFHDKNTTLRDKVGLWEEYVYDSKELAIEKSIAKQLKKYDTQTITDAKIKMLGVQNMQNASKTADGIRKETSQQVLSNARWEIIREQSEETIEDVKESEEKRAEEEKKEIKKEEKMREEEEALKER